MEITLEQKDFLQKKLLHWYQKGHRELPWRSSQNPYHIWISEIMLQQTQSNTVKNYFNRFIAEFPTVLHLADASIDDVLKLWSGLGYYSRARYLHQSAKKITQDHLGKFPQSEKELLLLPGIGRYTAGAIRSIAFGIKAPVVDGNVIRVLSRFFAIQASPWTHSGQKMYYRLAESIVPESLNNSHNNAPGDFNQALMELGATICTPKKPVCNQCPIQSRCNSRIQGTQLLFPPPKKEPLTKEILMGTILLFQKGTVFLAKRPEFGLFGGLFEPPTFELSPLHQNHSASLMNKFNDEFGIQSEQFNQLSLQKLPDHKHVLTHRILKIQPFVLNDDDKLFKPSQHKFYIDAGFYPAKNLSLGIASWAAKLLQGSF